MLSTTAPAGPRRHRRRGTAAVTGTLAVLAALCAYLLGTATPAAAHAVLSGTSPASGSVVDSAPEQVTLIFSETVRLTGDSVRVLGPDGERTDTGPVRDLGDGTTHRFGAPLRDDLPDGTYTVAWQAVSADSHPISGAFTFSVGAPSKTTVELPQQEAGGSLVGTLYDLARYAAYAGFLLLVGGAAFVLACWPNGARVRAVQRVVTTGWVGLTASTLALLLLRAPYTGSGELADAFDLGALGDVVGTKTGTALVSRLLLLAAAALFTAVLFGTYPTTATAEEDDAPERRRDVVTGLALGGTVVAAGLATTWAAAGHASTGIQTAIALPVDALHLLAVAAWLGGLATLTAALWSGTGTVPHDAVRRFSRIALGSVTVLAATGLYQSWRQVGTWSALTGTDYGRLLLLKVALVTVLVALGWYSRSWTGRLSRGASSEEAPADTVAALGMPRSHPFAVSPGSAPDPGPQSPDGLAVQALPHSASRRGGTPMAIEDAHGGTSRAPEGLRGRSPARGPGDEAPAAAGAARRTANRTDVGAPTGGDPAREAQLARQRQAMAAAERKRTRNADPHRSRLRRSVLAESTVAVVILAATTLLSGTEPGRNAEAADSGTGPAAEAPAAGSPRKITVPFDTGGPQGEGTAHVTLDPGRTGRNSLKIWLIGPNGKPLQVPEVTLSFTLPAKDLGPLRVTPRKSGYGVWTKDGVQLPVPGDWKMALTVRTSDIDQVTETRTLRIG